MKDSFLRAIDKVRGVADDIGARDFSLTVRITQTLTGKYLGDLESYVTITENDVKVFGNKNPHIKNTSAKHLRADLAGSERYFSITLTPKYSVGGFELADMPDNSSVDYIIKGVGLPNDGISCKLVSHVETSTKVTLIVKSYGKVS